MSQRCIIVGASHAAAQLATSLRQEGWAGGIRMIGDEQRLPYHRPPLSKAFLTSEKDADSLAIRPAGFYEKQQIEFLQGTVTSIDRAGRSIGLADGRQCTYDKLALCTGARARQLSLPGAGLAGVHTLRTLADVEAIRSRLDAAGNVVIIGGGYIGLEAAASLRKQGVNVLVLESAERILQRVTAPAVSAFYARVHREEGVSLHAGVTVCALEGDQHVRAVRCADGTVYPADLVIIGVGVVPNVELAERAGLDVDNGIRINTHCQTSDPDIVAAGDCANHHDPLYDRRVRLESVPNATEQAKCAAATLCGKVRAYASLPWFWSDQYDVKLQIAGLSEGHDQVVIRGDSHVGRSFAAFYLQGGRLIAADCVNRPKEFMLSKRLIAASCLVRAEDLADESVDVQALAEAVRAPSRTAA